MFPIPTRLGLRKWRFRQEAMLPDKDFPSAEEVFPLSGELTTWERTWFNMTHFGGGLTWIMRILKVGLWMNMRIFGACSAV